MIISNRLPVSVKKTGQRWSIQPSSGGLITALGPVLRNRGGLWLGWTGVSERVKTTALLNKETGTIGYTLVAVGLSEHEVANYYYGFSNEIIWPLFHNLQTLCNYNPEFWKSYLRVNQKYARKIAEVSRGEEFIWVHDYHLMQVGGMLRTLGLQLPTAFFLHIPFPPPDIFQKMPWRQQILEGLTQFDIIGFQTARHKRNFLQCVRAMLTGVTISGKGPLHTLRVGAREVRVGNFPIGIDYHSFEENARSAEVGRMAGDIQTALRRRCFILGIDRLDYTKGLPYKLNAMRTALRRHPELCGNVTFIQVVVPSRREIESYDNLKTTIEQMVSEINGEFAEPGWVPIQYIYRSLKRLELLAYYRSAEIALVTPLEDGMNLVAKEYCACSVDGNSVLILSEFAGAAEQLGRGALLVNPYDEESVADAIYQATTMDTAERKARMRRLQKNIQEHDIFSWVDRFLLAGLSKDLGHFPQQADALPEQALGAWFDGG